MICSPPMRRWAEWYQMALDSGLTPLITLAKRLAPHLSGILASAIHTLSTCVLEGMNNSIKSIERTAYGYRD
jgi:transposase